MNKRMSALLLALAVLLVAVPVALAYTSVSGQVNDASGNPWTHGGTVVCRQNSTQAQIGSGSINADGSWSVTLGSPAAATCTIDPAPGPNGDPASYTCAVPGGGGGGVQNYACGPSSTGTGPNAVLLSSFAGHGSRLAWWLAPLAAVVAGIVLLRRK